MSYMYDKPCRVLGLNLAQQIVYEHVTKPGSLSFERTIFWAARKGAVYIVILPENEDLDLFDTKTYTPGVRD